MKIKSSLSLAIAWLLTCTILLLLPGTTFPQKDIFFIPWIDKWIHIGLFIILSFLFCSVAAKKNNKRFRLTEQFIGIMVLAIVYGIAIEFIQENFVPNRSFEFEDIVADTIGTVIGWLIGFKRYIKNRPL